MNIFMVEVGIELENGSAEFECYNTLLIDENMVISFHSLYDENVIAFLDEKEAIKYIDEYVKIGVKNTYGFMWSIEKDIEDEEMENLVNGYYLEDVYYSREKVLYFKGGIAQ